MRKYLPGDEVTAAPYKTGKVIASQGNKVIVTWWNGITHQYNASDLDHYEHKSGSCFQLSLFG
ncbi:hypothetical protein [Nodularia sp. UHCC 0506]|uniref:hypothetical protein n=1 Tax=Nodularia sp. UHCC 0506 TaxID=3110243 RepID=UPI002B210256|nr:hypothetical protein [Nodularia sp. UHCC 0506]MEA5516567.1 hypothetical protein [Nodularia sp. UHCC 0506]